MSFYFSIGPKISTFLLLENGLKKMYKFVFLLFFVNFWPKNYPHFYEKQRYNFELPNMNMAIPFFEIVLAISATSFSKLNCFRVTIEVV